MNALVVVFVGLVIGGIFVAFWLGFLMLFLDGRKKNSRAMKFMGGIPLCLSSLFALWVAGAVLYGWMWHNSPSNIYEAAFGFRPSSDVTDIKSSYDYFADFGQTLLRFNASPQTIDKIVAIGLKPVPLDETPQTNLADQKKLYDPTNRDTPPWWRPTTSNSLRCYAAEHRVGDFATEREILYYDEKSHIAYYYYVGID